MKKLLIFILGISGSMSITAQIADSAEETCPIKTGMKIPSVILKDAENKDIDLDAFLVKKPTLLIFYRGGWCPYCNMHLAELQETEQKILDMGFQILAVSADRPAKLKESLDKHDMNYTLLSDSKLAFTQKMGLAFKMEESRVKTYKEKYNIDLEDASGETHHALPVPGAFLVDQKGVIQFSYVNPNYKVRVKAKVLLAAAESMVTKTDKSE